MLFVHRAAVNQIAPDLLSDETALTDTIERMADHGAALVESEIARRRRTAGTSPASQSKLHVTASLKTAQRHTERS